MMPLVNHTLLTSELGPPAAQMYEYVYGAGGVYVRARRDGLEAIVPVAVCELRGLEPVRPLVDLAYPRVPRQLVEAIVGTSITAAPDEALFYLWFDGDAGRWHLEFPAQYATTTSVRPTDSGGGAVYARALVEVHSHHGMEARFSGTDDADETGFRLFAVVGSLFSRPQIRLRVGVYGYFWEIPAETVFELPDTLECAVWSEVANE